MTVPAMKLDAAESVDRDAIVRSIISGPAPFNEAVAMIGAMSAVMEAAKNPAAARQVLLALANADAALLAPVEVRTDEPDAYISADGFAIIVPDDKAAQFKALWDAIPPPPFGNKVLPIFFASRPVPLGEAVAIKPLEWERVTSRIRETEAEAKAAAQADYEQRVRSNLYTAEPQASVRDAVSLESIIALVEAAQYSFERLPAAWNAFVKLRADILALAPSAVVVTANLDEVTRPIIRIENRTAREAFDIMCNRIRALSNTGGGK